MHILNLMISTYIYNTCLIHMVIHTLSPITMGSPLSRDVLQKRKICLARYNIFHHTIAWYKEGTFSTNTNLFFFLLHYVFPRYEGKVCFSSYDYIFFFAWFDSASQGDFINLLRISSISISYRGTMFSNLLIFCEKCTADIGSAAGGLVPASYATC